MSTLKLRLAKALAPEEATFVDAEPAKAEPPSTIKLINEVLASRAEDLHFFRPSMTAGCDRQNVYHYLKAPFHPSRQNPQLHRILDMGTAAHSVLQGYLADHPELYFAPEARVLVRVEGALVRGSCDGVVIRRSDGYRWGIEIKTINHNGFETLRAPKPEHVEQATIYMSLQKLWWITIIYFDKNNQNLKEFPVRYDALRWQAIKERIKFLYSFVESGELPKVNPKTCDRSFCQYCSQCDADVAAGKLGVVVDGEAQSQENQERCVSSEWPAAYAFGERCRSSAL